MIWGMAGGLNIIVPMAIIKNIKCQSLFVYKFMT